MTCLTSCCAYLQKAFGKCNADFMLNGGFCKATCGHCPSAGPSPPTTPSPQPSAAASAPPASSSSCSDTPPPGSPFSCSQQVGIACNAVVFDFRLTVTNIHSSLLPMCARHASISGTTHNSYFLLLHNCSLLTSLMDCSSTHAKSYMCANAA